MIQQCNTSVATWIIARALVFVEHAEIYCDQVLWDDFFIPKVGDEMKKFVLDLRAVFKHLRGDSVRACGSANLQVFDGELELRPCDLVHRFWKVFKVWSLRFFRSRPEFFLKEISPSSHGILR